MPIKSIIYCEFDHVVGPRITFQIPENILEKPQFDILSGYLIPKDSLRQKQIMVTAFGLKILGYPVGLENAKYKRNRLVFNLCFVFDADFATIQYEPVIIKLAHYLMQLELECGYLSTESCLEKLPHQIALIRQELNAKQICTIPITEATTIHLKLVCLHTEPETVQDHHVPLLLASEDKAFSATQWDLTTQQVLPFINGTHHIARISAESGVELNLVKACVTNLMYYGLVKLMPIFQYSNIYAATSKMIQLARNVVLQEECLKAVTRPYGPTPSSTNSGSIGDCSGMSEGGRGGQVTETTTAYGATLSPMASLPTPTHSAPAILAQPPNWSYVFRMYAAMRHGRTLKGICNEFKPEANGVDERALIRFGILKGIIRRVDRYPVFVTQGDLPQRAHFKYFDGVHSLDSICCLTSSTSQELNGKIGQHSKPRTGKSHADIVVLNK